MKQVIHIFGASGSGTTTLAKKISAELGYTFMDTDDYFWLPTNPMFTQKRPVEERLALMRRDIERAENAVLSGSLTDWAMSSSRISRLRCALKWRRSSASSG